MSNSLKPNDLDAHFMPFTAQKSFKKKPRMITGAKGMYYYSDDGRELPLFKLDTSSESHPFYTGTQKSVDNMGGRVEKFRNRFAKAGAKK